MGVSKLRKINEDKKYDNEAKRLTSQLKGIDKSDSDALEGILFGVFSYEDRFIKNYKLGNKNIKEVANAISDEFEKNWEKLAEESKSEKIKSSLRNNNIIDTSFTIWLPRSKMSREYRAIFTYLSDKDNKKEVRQYLNEWEDKKDIKNIISNIKSKLEKEGRLEWHEPAEP